MTILQYKIKSLGKKMRHLNDGSQLSNTSFLAKYIPESLFRAEDGDPVKVSTKLEMLVKETLKMYMVRVTFASYSPLCFPCHH